MPLSSSMKFLSFALSQSGVGVGSRLGFGLKEVEWVGLWIGRKGLEGCEGLGIEEQVVGKAGVKVEMGRGAVSDGSSTEREEPIDTGCGRVALSGALALSVGVGLPDNTLVKNCTSVFGVGAGVTVPFRTETCPKGFWSWCAKPKSSVRFTCSVQTSYSERGVDCFKSGQLLITPLVASAHSEPSSTQALEFAELATRCARHNIQALNPAMAQMQPSFSPLQKTDEITLSILASTTESPLYKYITQGRTVVTTLQTQQLTAKVPTLMDT
uniref:Uncharacterized protein n=1 Tax=Timema cristinae TaxID=61476 RepID=A0A7R9H4G0_TIMCR|nr:unnamed protein product [Timema cristinae]